MGLSNKGESGWTGVSSFVLEVPLRNLRPSVIYSVPCDRIVQRAYSLYAFGQSEERKRVQCNIMKNIVFSGTGVACIFHGVLTEEEIKIQGLGRGNPHFDTLRHSFRKILATPLA